MGFASWKERKPVTAALRDIYRAKDAETARQKLDEFDAGPWGRKYPAVAQSWRRNWNEVIPFFAFPEPVRRIIHTTNAIESLNAKLRKAVKARGHFPDDDAALKLLFLVLRNVARDWKMAAARMECCKDPVCHHLRRSILRSLMDNQAPHTRFLTVPLGGWLGLCPSP